MKKNIINQVFIGMITGLFIIRGLIVYIIGSGEISRIVHRLIGIGLLCIYIYLICVFEKNIWYIEKIKKNQKIISIIIMLISTTLFTIFRFNCSFLFVG